MGELSYTDPKNYVLFQMDDSYFYRTVIRNGQKMGDIRVSEKGTEKVSAHSTFSSALRRSSIRLEEAWRQLDHRGSLDAARRDLGQGKFGFYIPGSDQVRTVPASPTMRI